jgi:hypothetical protein
LNALHTFQNLMQLSFAFWFDDFLWLGASEVMRHRPQNPKRKLLPSCWFSQFGHKLHVYAELQRLGKHGIGDFESRWKNVAVVVQDIQRPTSEELLKLLPLKVPMQHLEDVLETDPNLDFEDNHMLEEMLGSELKKDLKRICTG